MTEGLFILTTIFVAYVVYAAIGEQKATAKSNAHVAKPEAKAPTAEQPKPQVAVATEKPAATRPTETKAATPKIAAKPAPAKPETIEKTPAPPAQSAGLKDPKTGEIATAYNNYRFTKRWIKEALVAEGLLDKIYTAKEINPETEAQIKEAMKKLEAMDKYQA